MPLEIRYIKRPDDKGWMKVILVSNNKAIYLCEGTKITIYKRIAEKSYFTIKDGNSEYVGQDAWISTINEKYLTTVQPKEGTSIIRIKYNGSPVWVTSPFKGNLLQQWATLTTGNGVSAQVTLNSIWPKYSPIVPGNHFIMAPDRSHANISTGGYAKSSGAICTDIWFPIRLAGQSASSSRYIHIGHLSEGCVTVYELTKWNAIYNYLITNRMAGHGGKLIGQLIVTL